MRFHDVVHAPVVGDDGEAALGGDEDDGDLGAGGADQPAQVAGMGEVLAAVDQQQVGEVVVDDATYTAKVGKRPLDLTFKEFELLKFLAQHPGRVFSRQQLLQEVWGYDYFGGTRTVDVHVRRLRAKLGPENETLIGTVRNVGYRFVLPTKESKQAEADARAAEASVDRASASA